MGDESGWRKAVEAAAKRVAAKEARAPGRGLRGWTDAPGREQWAAAVLRANNLYPYEGHTAAETLAMAAAELTPERLNTADVEATIRDGRLSHEAIAERVASEYLGIGDRVEVDNLLSEIATARGVDEVERRLSGRHEEKHTQGERPYSNEITINAHNAVPAASPENASARPAPEHSNPTVAAVLSHFHD